MTGSTADRIKGWLRVVYTDASVALVIGLVVTCCFLIAGAGILGPEQVAPEGQEVAFTLSRIFGSIWGKTGAFLFLLAGCAALLSTQIGQLAGWPRLLADTFRICFGRLMKRFPWRIQFRTFLLYFALTNMIIVFTLGLTPVKLIRFAAMIDGLVLTPIQALLLIWVHYVTLPRMLSPEAAKTLKPHPAIGIGLALSVLVFGYICLFQVPRELFRLIAG
jgi:Mn2+/Fe2+ NRAMP family transporter